MDDFLDDIPLPDENAAEHSDVVKDECDAGFKLAFVGAGQAGARIVESFYKLGYRRVCAVNTTSKDLVGIQIPEENKLVLDIGEGGAGKDATKGARAIDDYKEDVYDLMRRCFGKEYDRVIVCVGAGGGTGTGACTRLIEVCRESVQSLRIETPGGDPAVGVMVSLPMVSEGQKVNANASELLDELFTLAGNSKGRKKSARQISPLIVVDNERIHGLYPGLAVTKFWDVANRSIAGLFHLFNNAVSQDSDITTCDKADLNDVLRSGVITFGACPIRKWGTSSDISHAIRDNLRKTVLVGGLDMKSAEKAACVFIGGQEVLDTVPHEYLDHGFEMLGRVMADNSTVHRGIYKRDKPGLTVYTMLGELDPPTERLDEIRTVGDCPLPKRR
jgi:cell division GTPase FtsZ